MLKQCALAFALTKPTEWDHFRQEWYRANPPVSTSVFTDNVSILDIRTEEVKDEPKPHRSRAMKREELE